MQQRNETPGGRAANTRWRNMWLSVHIAVMATLATWMLGMGGHEYSLPLLATLAAILSVILTDWLGWLRLHRILANVAMLVAAFASLNRFLELGSQDQLMAIASLLVYVQIVLLFQQKNLRIYGQLAVFSLLQVVVACLLNDSLEFGLLLLLYLVIALLGLVLFFVDREVGSLGTVARLPFRWPWSRPAAPALDRGSAVRVWIDLPPVTFFRSVISRRLFSPLLTMLTASLVFAILFFYTAPRSEGLAWSGGSQAVATVGFSPEISFREMGRVLISNERVMRVAFTKPDTNEPYTVIGRPYMRGSLLTRYITTNGVGQWLRDDEPNMATSVRLAPPPPVRELVLQDVLLEPTRRSMLFSAIPAYADDTTDPDIYVHRDSRLMFRRDASRRQLAQEYRFRVLTSAFKFGSQTPVTPYHEPPASFSAIRRLARLTRRLARLDYADEFPGLIAEARRIIATEAPTGNTYDKARALEHYFQTNESFTYSLDFEEINEKRRPAVDPIEDFVTNHRTGHCEYFASALALMLRSQNIPSRLVIGYHGGEYNYVGGYFDIRQRHAHAWVEAYLPPEDIPESLLDPAEQHPGGGWLRLDPTPTDEAELASQINIIDQITKSFDYARWLWNDYILRLTKERQQDTVFGALAEERTVPLEEVIDTRYWINLVKRAIQWEIQTLVSQPVSWRGGVAAAILCLLAYIIYRGLPRIWALLMLLSTLGRTGRRSATRVVFYQRLEAALARLDLHRQASQTPRELADFARQQLATEPQLEPVSTIPRTIVDAFYHVRFGQWAPEPDQLADIHQQLERLETAIANRNGNDRTAR